MDSLSIATERAIVSIGDAIADTLTHGYDTVAKSTEEAMFPVQAEQKINAREAEQELETMLDKAYADHVMVNKALEEEEEKKKSANRMMSLPSFRRNNKPQPQPPEKKTEPDKKKKKFKPSLKVFHRGY